MDIYPAQGVPSEKDKWLPQKVRLSQRESATAENELKLSSVTGREAGAATEALTPHTSPTVLKAVAIATTKVLQQQKRASCPGSEAQEFQTKALACGFLPEALCPMITPWWQLQSPT